MGRVKVLRRNEEPIIPPEVVIKNGYGNRLEIVNAGAYSKAFAVLVSKTDAYTTATIWLTASNGNYTGFFASSGLRHAVSSSTYNGTAYITDYRGEYMTSYAVVDSWGI